MPKSKDAFRTISEVAEWLDTPAHVLRFWESKFTQVKPVKRAGGRRYYRPADMLLLGGIKKLLHDDGLTIKGAQKLLREHGVKHVAALSQMLDEDLIEEAAYELDAQPEPIVEAPSTVLSFPSRAAEQEKAEPVIEPIAGSPAQAAPTEPEQEAPVAASAAEASPVEASPASPPSEDGPAFGTDALPAFLRRAPTPSSPTPPPPTQPSMSTPEGTSEDLEQAPAFAKVTIDPEARFEPVATEAETTPDAAQAAQPIFSHRMPQAEAPASPEPASVQEDIAQVPTPLAAATGPEAPRVDVPSIAKIAPALDSYAETPAGVLAALPRARRISASIAAEMAPHLTELRALRDRMRG